MSAGRKLTSYSPRQTAPSSATQRATKPCKDQAKLDEIGLWSSFGCPGGQDLGYKAIHSTYSLHTTYLGISQWKYTQK
jgi:hypothetical protein